MRAVCMAVGGEMVLVVQYFRVLSGRFSMAGAAASTMDPQEWNKCLRDAKLTPSPLSKPDAGSIFKQADRDGGGELVYYEYVMALAYTAAWVWPEASTEGEGVISVVQANTLVGYLKLPGKQAPLALPMTAATPVIMAPAATSRQVSQKQASKKDMEVVSVVPQTTRAPAAQPWKIPVAQEEEEIHEVENLVNKRVTSKVCVLQS